MEGFIALHRQILEWEWYDDANTFRLFLHCLLKANYKDKNWRGHDIKRGQFISTPQNLADELGLSRQQVRTSLKKLNSTNEITSKGTSQHTVFTVEKYDEYQTSNQQNNQQATSEQPADNQRVTTTNKDNKETKKQVSKARKTRISDNAMLSDEWRALAENYWLNNKRPDLSANEEFEKFKDHHIARGTTSADWKRSWSTWYRNAVQFNKPSGGLYETPRPNQLSTVQAATERNADHAAQVREQIAALEGTEARAGHDKPLAVIDGGAW